MKFMKRLDQVLIICVLIGLGVVFAVQYIMVFDAAELFFKIGEQLEQQPVHFYEEFPEARVTSTEAHQSVFATITIQCENFSSLEKAVLLINGKEVGDFRDKEITVKVSSGDVLAIDGSFYVHEIIFKVVAVSENVVQPEIGQVVRVFGNTAMLGEVCLK